MKLERALEKYSNLYIVKKVDTFIWNITHTDNKRMYVKYNGENNTYTIRDSGGYLSSYSLSSEKIKNSIITIDLVCDLCATEV